MNNQTFRPWNKLARRTSAFCLALLLLLLLSISHWTVVADHADTADRVEDFLEAGTTGGTVGLYLKEVGVATPLAAVNQGVTFEPASTIKAVVHFHAMRQVQDGATINGNVVMLNTQIPWIADTTKFDGGGNYIPGGADCPNDNTVNMNTDLDDTLQMMMIPSDNATTEGLRAFFTDASINTTLTNLNMNATEFNHPLGCAGPTPNELTLVDAGRLYEAVVTTYLNDATRADAFALMLTDGATFNTIIDQEAAGLGLSNTAINDFKAQRQSALKAGSYTMGDGREHRTVAGWAELAYKDANCDTDPRDFVYGAFQNDSTTVPTNNIRQIGVELFREEIRHALESWAACEADLQIVSMSVLSPPAEIDVNSSVQITLNTAVRNNGPADTIDAELSLLAGAPSDCTINPDGSSDQTVTDLAQGVIVNVETNYTIECTEPSFHTFTFSGAIAPDDDDVADPGAFNNQDDTDLTVAVIAYADLAILGWDFSELDNAQIQDLLIGGDFVFPTTKTLHNFGDTALGLYANPVDANVSRSLILPDGIQGSVHIGSDEAPASIVIQSPGDPDVVLNNQPAGSIVEIEGPATISVHFAVASLAIGVDRTVIEEFDLQCVQPGLYDIEFTNEIAAQDEHVEDPDPSDNTVNVTRTVECITPVQINIRPANAKNQINLNSKQTVPVAILTTVAGEYGLPTAFDATAIDYTTARFGTEATLNGGGGSIPSPDKNFIRDAHELNEKTKDGDLDMVLLVSTPGAGMDATTTEACMTGSYLGDDDNTYTFYGCDAVQVK